jgi:hypothetical protein
VVRAARHQPGGINGLRTLLAEHGEAVEADLQRYYHIALSDLAAGRLSWRRLSVLISRLPLSATLWHELHGSAVEWDVSDHLLATVVDLLAAGNWQRGGGKGRRPRRMKRPGAGGTTRHGRTEQDPHDVATFLARYQPIGA